MNSDPKIKTTTKPPAKKAGAISPAPAATPLRPLHQVQALPSGEASQTAARPARVRMRHRGAVLSFLMLVLAPLLVVFHYLYHNAADQYLSQTSFSVHQQKTEVAVTSLLGGLKDMSRGTEDVDVLYQYIQSHDLVAAVDGDLDLRARFSPHYDMDPVFGLAPDAPFEDLVEYWNRMVIPEHDIKSDIITVSVYAFRAEDAHAINTAILDHSRALVERLSQTALEDTVQYALADLTRATDRLKSIRLQILQFRETNQNADPRINIQSQLGILGRLEQQLTSALVELDMLRDTTSKKDPRIRRAERKVTALRNRIEQERTAAIAPESSQSGEGLFADLGVYEALLVDQEFAQTAYVSARAGYDTALTEARRTSRYLVPHIAPSLPHTAQYPERALLGGVITVFILLAWVLLLFMGYSLRDRR